MSSATSNMNQLISDEVRQKYRKFQLHSLIGVFIGYMCYYIVRNNFVLSTPYLMEKLELSKTQIGMLTSAMLITYGCSKGFMSVLADKANPRYFMALGLFLCILVNICMGFSTSFYLFVALVILLGVFQGMGVGPSIITVGHWYSRGQRGRASTTWNVSHNLGGGLVAPIVGTSLAYFGNQNWELSTYIVPALIALMGVFLVLYFTKRRPVEEGLPTVEEMYHEETVNTKIKAHLTKKPEDMTALQIFYQFVFKNPNSWFLVGIDIFTYMVRFGMLTWIPLYLLKEKGLTKTDMGAAFMFFEWAAIPSTLVAGWLIDKFFRGRIMYLPMICMAVVFFCVFGYMSSDSIFAIIFFSAIVGCLVYIPQAMVAVQAMEVIPSFALGSAVGLRGFMSYIVGSTLGTTLFGFVVDHFGWNSGFYTIMCGAILCSIFCLLSHLGLKNIERM
ncbi:phosphoglycerate transporter [Vespertiliibacter pulmonis]|uniref:OPA family phosphoglycerate-like MFS transporter n=1 Tax=Vespertiliibacter pulmonis TaxID=1443036 RepID=A0A3N4VHQ9_9PAST|nr:MFS transporter [Vespertiliibacter pulmonis]QLB20701.1 phosphoglycerate transporter [Vespertiliibacter pulmonis]RPE82586.1 OPA family phosphoglycerate-like MFS transporter [Vespertiliibacter pulmonis]